MEKLLKGFSAVSEKELLDVNGGYDSPVDANVHVGDCGDIKAPEDEKKKNNGSDGGFNTSTGRVH